MGLGKHTSSFDVFSSESNPTLVADIKVKVQRKIKDEKIEYIASSEYKAIALTDKKVFIWGDNCKRHYLEI